MGVNPTHFELSKLILSLDPVLLAALGLLLFMYSASTFCWHAPFPGSAHWWFRGYRDRIEERGERERSAKVASLCKFMYSLSQTY